MDGDGDEDVPLLAADNEGRSGAQAPGQPNGGVPGKLGRWVGGGGGGWGAWARSVLEFVVSFRTYVLVLSCFLVVLTILVWHLPSNHIVWSFATHPSRWSYESFGQMLHSLRHHYHESSLFFVTFLVAYLFLQTFSIPGTLVLNTFAGVCMGPRAGFLVCCVGNTAGACLCYLLAKHTWNDIVEAHLHERMAKFRAEIARHKSNLWIYLTLLRMFPLCPCWFVNMASGLVGIPFAVHAFSVFVGLMPYNYLSVNAGAVLGHIGTGEAVNLHITLLKLSAVAVLLALPLIFRDRIMASLADARVRRLSELSVERPIVLA